MSSIIFPLRTNIKSLQRWGDNDISKRIKQSFILYDEIILETGTYNFQGADNDFVFENFDQWSPQNSKEGVVGISEEIENRQEDAYIRVFDGKTHVEKLKFRVQKKNEFLADFRTADVISEIESGSYGKETGFLKYLVVSRNKNYWEIIKKNTIKDLADSPFAEEVRKIHGAMPAVVFLNNLNDSLSISHHLKSPVAIDQTYAQMLKLRTKSHVGLHFTVLERLAQIGIPDFSIFSLEKILELRKDKALESFRRLISELSTKLQSENDLEIETLFAQELWQEIKEIAPTKKEVALDTTLGAISFIPCLPLNIITSATDFGKGLKEYRDFSSNWLSFILRAKEGEKK